MFSFRGRPAVFYDIVDDGGGNGGGKKYGLSNVKKALQGGVNNVIAAVANGQGTPAANTNTNASGLSNIAGAMQGIVNGVQNKTGNAAITDINNGKDGSGGRGGGSRATYIASDGSKKTGTTKVTPGQSPDFYRQMSEYYRQAYEDTIAANAAELNAAKQRAQEVTDEQLGYLDDQYAGTNLQLYRDYMDNKKTLPQQLAAMGYSGGLSESSLLRLMNSYEEGVNENERAKALQVADARRQLAQNLYELEAKTRESDRSAKTTHDSQEAALKEAEYRDLQNRAATMAASGDFSEYANLGFSPSQIAYLKQVWREAKQALAA